MSERRARGGTMRALTIKQPWVHAILHEGKDIENRSWQRHFRGWLALHASAKPDRYARYPRGHPLPDLDSTPCSAICGVFENRSWQRDDRIRERDFRFGS